jgi:hypothetical protein
VKHNAFPFLAILAVVFGFTAAGGSYADLIASHRIIPPAATTHR